jgi:phosphoribosylaminoimidazole-succinocarboxamide synthase
MKKVSSGKVREVYELNQKELVIVTTDRISAFDVILPTQIRGKGIALNTISNFWFDITKKIIPNHIVSTEIKDMPEAIQENSDYYENRTVLVKKLDMLPYEFIVRGYMFGSMWKAYSNGEEFCGQKIKGEYKLAQKLEKPIITPSAKNNIGHDEYISPEILIDKIGESNTNYIFEKCLELYKFCSDFAAQKGIIVADTKFELGYDNEGNIILGDEIFTPDTSRFWDINSYETGISPKSYDKQFLRDWLIENNLDGKTPAPEIPNIVATKTENIYRECCKKITGKEY